MGEPCLSSAAIAGIGLINLVCGIAIGVLIERTRWNRLIRDGLLPRPWRK